MKSTSADAVSIHAVSPVSSLGGAGAVWASAAEPRAVKIRARDATDSAPLWARIFRVKFTGLLHDEVSTGKHSRQKQKNVTSSTNRRRWRIDYRAAAPLTIGSREIFESSCPSC